MNLPLPTTPGAYALQLVLYESHEIQAGRLGRAMLPPGNYLYFGSANGPGGIRGRLGRHLRGGQRAHWHIDYLRTCARIQGYYYLALSKLSRTGERSEPRLECLWSQEIASLPGAFVPLPGFGASDCRSGCPAHLLAFPPDAGTLQTGIQTQNFRERIQAALAQAAGVAPASVAAEFARNEFADGAMVR